MCFFFSSRRRHTRCALVTGVQTCALPIFTLEERKLIVNFPPNSERLSRRIPNLLINAGNFTQVIRTMGGTLSIFREYSDQGPDYIRRGCLMSLSCLEFRPAHLILIPACLALAACAPTGS